MVYPRTTGFHWGSLDFQWYIEACKSRPGPAQTPTGFHDVNRFITLPPHKTTGCVSIPDYVKAVTAGKEADGTTPIELSDKIHAHADKALRILDGLRHGGGKELRLTLGDIRTVAYMGKYYAHKIRGATELALYRKSKKQAHQDAAVRELTKAAQYWRLYASTALGRYENPLWTNRVGYCDWRKQMTEVLNDIKTAGGTVNMSSMSATLEGTILEAEDALFKGAEKAASAGGHTGEGYLDFSDATGQSWVRWQFNAPEKGTYILEVRYALEHGKHPSDLRINKKDAGNIVLWTTGGKGTWAWDRKTVVLRKGKNTIRLTPIARVRIDHLNVLFGG